MHIVWISSDIILRFILMQRSLNYWRLVIVLEKHHAFKRYNMLPCQKKTRENTKLNEVAILVLWEVLKRENISVARFFLQLVWQDGDDKKNTNATKQTKAAGRRNQTKESAATLLCLVNCAWICNGPQCVWRFVDIGLIRRVSVTIPVIAVKLPSFTECFFSLNSTFCKLDTIAIASSAWQAFTPSVIDWSSFVFRCFRFFELVHVNKK